MQTFKTKPARNNDEMLRVGGRTTVTNRAAADLLRHLDHPQRLRRNPLATRYFSTHQLDAAAAVASLRAAVVLAMRALSSRQRAILERCDFQHEMHATVIRALAISERYFYRERACALKSIARHLQAQPVPGACATVRVDPLSAALAHATHLAQAGCVDRAREALLDIVHGGADLRTKVEGLSRLIEVLTYSGRIAEALDAVTSGHALTWDRSDDEGCLRAHIDAGHALALRFNGDERAAEIVAHRARRSFLVSFRSGTRSEDLAASAVSAWAVMAERALEAADGQRACALTDELLEIVDAAGGATPLTRLRANFHRLLARSYVSLDVAIPFALERLLAEALALGLTAEAGMIAPSVAGSHRILGNPDRAVQCVAPLLDLFRQVCSGEALAALLAQLARASVDTGNIAQALPLLHEARAVVPDGSLVYAATFLYLADAQLVAGHASAALQSAHRAIELFVTLGRPRFTGLALRYQALALEALGQPEHARSRIRESLELLEAYARPEIIAEARHDARRLKAALR